MSSSGPTLDELETYLASSPAAEDVLQRFSFSELTHLKKILDPIQRNSLLNEMIADYEHNPRPELGQEIVNTTRVLQNTPEHLRFRQIFSALFRFHQLGSKTAISNRARRARSSQEVFTSHAGRSKLEGERDEHGNVKDGNLAVAGAFSGMKILVLIYNHETNNDFNPVRDIVTRLGFELIVYDASTTCRSGGCPMSSLTPSVLDDQLEECSQCWIISGSHYAHIPMSDTIRDVILHHWKKGLGLYILGDNDPFYREANYLLSGMYPDLNVFMSDNYPGQHIVTLDPRESAVGGYFNEDYITTGIENCYSGYTVAKLNNAKLIPGFVNILYERTDVLVLGYVPARDDCGPVILSGAFTTFYHQLHLAGSTRLVENCIAFLSTRIESSVQVSDQTFDFTNALVGECSITYDEGPLAIMLYAMEDPTINLSDLAMHNALARGAENARVVGRHPYTFANAELFSSVGHDPFTRRVIAEIIPVVPFKSNYHRLTSIVCNVFTNGLYLPVVAWKAFISACQYLLDTDAGNSAIWNFFLEQALSNLIVKSDFGESGVRVPLRDAIALYARRMLHDQDSFDACKFNIEHSEVLVKLFRLTNPPTAYIDLIRHRIFVRNLFAYLRTEMLKDNSFVSTLEKSCYDWHLDIIPIYNSGHLSGYYPKDLPSPPETFSREMLTWLYFLIWNNVGPIKIRSFIKSLEYITRDRSYIWTPRSQEIDVISILNSRFKDVSYRRHSSQGPVLFATTYGPSSLYCSGCGYSFIPPGLDINYCSTSELDRIRIRRNAHFAEVFQLNGRPTQANYHLAVRHVLFYYYRGYRVYQDSMMVDVLRRLRDTDRGNHYAPELLTDLRAIIESYLELRRNGAVEDDDTSYLTKLLVELNRYP